MPPASAGAVSSAEEAGTGKIGHVVQNTPPPRHAPSHQTVVAVDAASTSSWPAPFVLSDGSRKTAELSQKLHVLTLDYATPETPAPQAKYWPEPSAEPQGPRSTVLAEQQHLARLLEAEEDEHRAWLRQKRAAWRQARHEEVERLAFDGDDWPQTAVERRRLAGLRARREAEQERLHERIVAGRRLREAQRHAEREEDAERHAAADAAFAAAEAERIRDAEVALKAQDAEFAALDAAGAMQQARAATKIQAAERGRQARQRRNKLEMAKDIAAAKANARAKADAAAKAKAEEEAALAAAAEEAAEEEARADAEAVAAAAAAMAATAAAAAAAEVAAAAAAEAATPAPTVPAPTVSVPIAAAPAATALSAPAPIVPSMPSMPEPPKLDLNATMAFAASPGGAGALRLNPSEITLGRSIAPGAFAEVFRGLLWGQKVAVKRLFVDREGADAESLRKELLHETRVLAALSHPCILTLVGYTDEPAQMVLEVLDGTAYAHPNNRQP